MQSAVPFAFEDRLVRVVERSGAPWFAGKDVCDCLGIAKYHQALEALDEDERGTCTVGTPGGEQAMIVISEPGVYRLVFRSRKPEAERFKRWLAHDVLPVLRKTGKYEVTTPQPAQAQPGLGPIPDSHLYRLYLVREARQLFGAERARALWPKLGLPLPPPPAPTAIDEAMLCLRHLLDSAVHEGGPAIRALLEQALEDNEEARALLLGAGIRVMSDREAFMIANRSPRLSHIFQGTEWAGIHARVLRRLPSVQASGTARFGGIQQRACLVPGHLLDDDAPDTVARRMIRS